MGTSMKSLSAAEIHARLAEISKAEKAYAVRDFDSELAAVLKVGGDVDAVEAAQLEQERQGRRLRAERTALEELLPEAVRREAQSVLDGMLKEHQALEKEIAPVVKEIVVLLDKLTEVVGKYSLLNGKAADLTHSGWQLARQTGASLPRLGTFQYAPIGESHRRFDEVYFRIRSNICNGYLLDGVSHGKDLGGEP